MLSEGFKSEVFKAQGRPLDGVESRGDAAYLIRFRGGSKLFVYDSAKIKDGFRHIRPMTTTMWVKGVYLEGLRIDSIGSESLNTFTEILTMRLLTSSDYVDLYFINNNAQGDPGFKIDAYFIEGDIVDDDRRALANHVRIKRGVEYD